MNKGAIFLRRCTDFQSTRKTQFSDKQAFLGSLVFIEHIMSTHPDREGAINVYIVIEETIKAKAPFMTGT